MSNLPNNGAIYLSGGMQHAVALGSEWRVATSVALRKLNYSSIDITELDNAYVKKHGALYFPKIGKVKERLKYKSNVRQHFIRADLELIQKHSDAVILYYDESVRLGAGTLGEAQVAYLNGIPLFLVSAWGDDWSEIPGWLQAMTTKIFPNFQFLYLYLAELPSGILKRDIYGNHGVNGNYLCNLCGRVFQKQKTTFVSKVFPLYCKSCVNLVRHTHEEHADRYTFMQNHLKGK